MGVIPPEIECTETSWLNQVSANKNSKIQHDDANVQNLGIRVEGKHRKCSKHLLIFNCFRIVFFFMVFKRDLRYADHPI